ncbi:MAG: PIN domain-containing protein [Nitriliruptor sp.]|nr:MAG: PIN domain-containing protein [Nitriliruptor sp.]
MILLDTTVLVYAVGADHRLRTPARRLITSIGVGRVAATTTPEVIEEFTHVRARREGRDDAVALAHEFVTLLTPLTPVTPTDLTAGLEVFARIPSLGCSDAVLVAVARRLAAPLVSADRGFEPVLGDDLLMLDGLPLRELT